MLKKIFKYFLTLWIPKSIKLKGKAEMFVRRSAEGEWYKVWEGRNLVVTVGKAHVAGLINGTTSGAFTYMAIGSSSTTPSSNDTALGSELSRVSATTSRVTTDETNDTAQWVATFTASGSWTVQEMGVFNASSGGTMLNRIVFTAINLSADDQLQITYKLDVD